MRQEERRENHTECGDTKARLYTRTTLKGDVFHCFNCGVSGFIPNKYKYDLSKLKERLASGGTEITEEVDTIHLPYDVVPELPPLALMWLNKYGIDYTTARKYGFVYSERMNRLILPLYDEEGALIFWQGRGLARPTKDFPKYINTTTRVGKYKVFKNEVSKSVCLVEDILSAIKVCLAGINSIPILGSYVNGKLLTYCKDYDRIYLWLDYDKKFESIKYSQKIRTLTGKPCHSIVTELDPKEYTIKQIQDTLR